MIFLVDHHLDGYVVVFLGTLKKRRWLELLSIDFVTLKDVGLPIDTSDRDLWRFAQTNGMFILTANRNMKGVGSLEQTIREQNTNTSFPVVTISDLSGLDEFDYRERCVDRLIEITLDTENYLGVGRLFIP
ncbi:DUF5615 family PIN-like protein [Vacuolonema iberomarrocanum]|uniref:DUF5615 family PIN-like protein n=1 Tax=Vacuolonema iberomarrocanum TaxID=3454632 RepID=UPI001A0D80C8|nr:DUF5615 family PIN-like protein [filamentous cyanobacterium LEGE 07170]